jgi:hypothetical protein
MRICVLTTALVSTSMTAVANDVVYEREIRPLLTEYCITCHSTEKQKGELDLERFTSMALVRRDPGVWEHSLEQFANQEMPPKGKPQPTAEQMKRLSAWMHGTLEEIARATAGDPGPVVLRRLSNMEYTYTVRDLTRVDSLDPVREFPADGAAGEGFTNAGAALVMSPALLQKYLDAAKEIASHAVLTPEGVRFSVGISQQDCTDEILGRIRGFYGRYCADGKGSAVNLQGIKFETNAGGRLPVERYLDALTGKPGRGAGGLNTKYLETLRKAFTETKPSLVLDALRAKYCGGKLTAEDIGAWQQSLWRFASVGHIGKKNGPVAWQEPVTPLVAQHEMRVKLAAPKDGSDVVLYLAAGDAGDITVDDTVLWENARLVAPGRADLPLREVRSVVQRIEKRRNEVIANVTKCLAAAHEAQVAAEHTDVVKLAARHGVDAKMLAGWLDYLGIGSAGEVKLEPLLVKKMDRTPDYDFIKGWTGEQALSVVANSSDATVRIPGVMKAHSVATHPSPQLASVIAWRSPVAGELRASGQIQHAHPECGNGTTWALEHRRGHTREVLASGVSNRAMPVPMGRFDGVRVLPGDVIAVVIGPRDGNHVCDLTAVDLTLSDGTKDWDLAKDVSPNILAGNPHADQHGNKDVWHFLTQPATSEASPAVPEGSVLAQWRKATDEAAKTELAMRVQQLLEHGTGHFVLDSPDRQLHTQLLSFNGPLLAAALRSPSTKEDSALPCAYGLHESQFGRHPDGGSVNATSLCLRSPSVIEVRLPGSLAEGAEFVVTGRLHEASVEGSVQMQVLPDRPETLSGLIATRAEATLVSGQWSDNNLRTQHNAPVIVQNGSVARKRFETAFEEFRALFPVALCYTKIVPVDEVVTLTLFHREDEHLKRLMLGDAEKAEIDRLWDELRFVSEAPLKQVDVFEQLWQYATQDAKPEAFEPMREPILRDAELFQKQQLAAEPKHVQAVLDFAEEAWRRSLSDAERDALTGLYQKLRAQKLAHDDAVRMMLARVLMAPAFLYRGEKPPSGSEATPVNNWELATRLSYFLWASAPDEKLRSLAAKGELQNAEVLAQQARRMVKDARARRLATEFGCQWLHVHDVATLDEKSERHFPTFVGLRDEMQEEVVRFFTDLFVEDRSVLSLIDADHTFVNGALAEHYRINTNGSDWQRVDGLRQLGRGGMLGWAATLAKQSGASRTSPILRGNWLSEVVLGEKLPRPPKDVPVLPDEAPQGLTERQLIEKHSSDAACARCHQRIDPMGFALEGFDAIGRARTADTRATLADGTTLEGLAGLRTYLVETRRDDFLKQFCRKLLGYALGRGVQLSDEPLLEAMMTELKANEYRVSSAIETIVHSEQFRKVRGRDASADE